MPIPGLNILSGEDAGGGEGNRIGVVEAAPACGHAEMLTRPQDRLRQRRGRGDTFGELLVAIPEAIDLALQAVYLRRRPCETSRSPGGMGAKPGA